LRPEVTRNLEGGLRLQTGNLSTQVAVFDMKKIDGQRSFRSGPDTFIFVNATTRVRGVEWEFRGRLPSGHSIFANYAFHNARHLEFRPTLATNFDDYALRMAPRHIAGGGLNLLVSRYTWSASLSYVGSRPLRDNVVNPQILPSYTLVNSSISARFGRVQAVLSATNIADRYYIADDFSSQDAGNAGMPRRLAIQLRYSF
jgi:outer membrane receptor protein involved in Fe transport